MLQMKRSREELWKCMKTRICKQKRTRVRKQQKKTAMYVSKHRAWGLGGFNWCMDVWDYEWCLGRAPTPDFYISARYEPTPTDIEVHWPAALYQFGWFLAHFRLIAGLPDPGYCPPPFTSAPGLQYGPSDQRLRRKRMRIMWGCWCKRTNPRMLGTLLIGVSILLIVARFFLCEIEYSFWIARKC